MFNFRTIASLTILLLFTSIVAAVGCNTKENITGPPNLHPIDTSAPVFVNRVPNGELYNVGTEGVNKIHLLHLYGNNGYDFGYAAGQLLGPQMKATLSGAWSYFKEQILESINGTMNKYHLPQSLINQIAEKGLEFLLDWQNEESKQFVDPEIFAEMRGMADAAGMDYDMIRRIHYIGEITKGQCSLYGAWGNATLSGKTLQLRALDWDTGAGLQNHPTVTIYHPLNDKMGHAFANVGWAGWIGSLTGMSSKKVGISEIGIYWTDFPPYFGNTTFVGIPFVFLERQILQHAEDVFDAESIIRNANRTCTLLLGVGDGKHQTARMVQYSETIVRFFNDTDLEPQAWWHPRIQNVVYAGMDWFCPFYQHSLSNQLNLYHGTLTPALSIMNVTAAVMTGNLHAAVYDLTDGLLYVGNHAPASATTAGVSEENLRAYAQPFLQLNASALFVKPFGTT
jgi:isopenicillin-N N-acyltransferase-like protein